jgi:hypothetical protein
MVVTAFTETGGMRWHRYNDVRPISLLVRLHDFQKTLGKPITKRSDPVVLEKYDGAGHLRGV